MDYSPAAHINLVSGDAQGTLAGTGFAHPFAVQVLDAHGYPVRDGEKVDFTVQPAGPHPGLATFPSGQTNATVGFGADGYATSPALTAGSRAGAIQVIASVPQSPARPRPSSPGPCCRRRGPRSR